MEIIHLEWMGACHETYAVYETNRRVAASGLFITEDPWVKKYILVWKTDTQFIAYPRIVFQSSCSHEENVKGIYLEHKYVLLERAISGIADIHEFLMRRKAVNFMYSRFIWRKSGLSARFGDPYKLFDEWLTRYFALALNCSYPILHSLMFVLNKI